MYSLEFCLGFLGDLPVILGYIFCLKEWKSTDIYLFNLAVSDLLFQVPPRPETCLHHHTPNRLRSHSVVNPAFYFLLGDQFRELLLGRTHVVKAEEEAAKQVPGTRDQDAGTDRGKGLEGKLFKSVKSERIQSAAPVTVIQNEPKPQSWDTHGDAGNNRASWTKTRCTDFRLLLPQLEGRQWGVKGVERTTRDTFPARTMNPQGRHPPCPVFAVSGVLPKGGGDERSMQIITYSAKMLIPPLQSVSTNGTADLRPRPASYSLSGTRLPPRSSLTSDDILCGPPGGGGSSTPSSRCRGRRGAWRSTDSRT
ncbi:hypothetical protein JZ751_013648 [Albula glossodonta]|uniref:Uncharacterized protein n=1 Tax=Albula glossodonta TaxID=121402 RepID=A0A8T2P1F8_9TELE|nr:hypothetical protein JZ751_013648 [Albula glossodonta]